MSYLFTSPALFCCLLINTNKNGLFVAPIHNGLKKGVSLQWILSSWSKNFKLRTLKKYQSLNRLLTLNKCFIQLLLFGFSFLDLLIKFIKMRLLYILYCPPAPATWRQGQFHTLAILHVPIYRSSPLPSCLPIGWRSGPSLSHVFVRRRERGETSIASLHVGWQRAQKILVLVMFMPHMKNGQG
jgi:hypothetical protein